MMSGDSEGTQGHSDLLLCLAKAFILQSLPYASAVSKKLMPRSQACLTHLLVRSCDYWELELTQFP